MVIIRRTYKPKIDKLYIQVNEPKGIPAFTYLVGETEHNHKLTTDNIHNHDTLTYLKNTDLTSVENIIGKFEKRYFPKSSSR